MKDETKAAFDKALQTYDTRKTEAAKAHQKQVTAREQFENQYRQVRDGVIEEVAFHGHGCAISQASASLMTERLKGRSLVDVRGISKEDVLGDLGIEISPARLKCALLPLKVLKVGAYGLANYELEEDDEQASASRRAPTLISSWTRSGR